MKKFNAFTLAEVLITLSIIGVVVAMTMPTLIANYQKHMTVNRLKETYSILYQAIRMSETENGQLSEWIIPQSEWDENNYNQGKIFAEKYITPYLKIAKECKYLSNECWADNYRMANGNDLPSFNGSTNHGYGVVLANGAVMTIRLTNDNENIFEIYIDLNGKQSPNLLSKDAFIMLLSKNKFANSVFGDLPHAGVYFYGNSSERIKLKNNCSESGVYCGALIMHDGWKIKKDYPW